MDPTPTSAPAPALRAPRSGPTAGEWLALAGGGAGLVLVLVLSRGGSSASSASPCACATCPNGVTPVNPTVTASGYCNFDCPPLDGPFVCHG